jgi:hypothetical protein
MEAVVTIDGRKSRKTPGSRASELVQVLNSEPDIPTLLPFEVTVGDEVQGVLAEPTALVALLRKVERERAWWVGIGLGYANELGLTPRVSTGPIFIDARIAVDRAKKLPWGVATESRVWRRAADLERAIALWVTLLQMRSPRGWETVDLRQRGFTELEIAETLGVTQQAVNQRLRAAFFTQDEEGAVLINHLLSEVPK